MLAFLDVDGVLADFPAAAFKHHGFPENTYDQPHAKGIWDIELVVNWASGDFWSPLANHEFWANIPPMPDAFKILQLLERRFGDNIVLLTAHSKFTTEPNNHHFSSGRHAWINRYLPEYRDKFFIGRQKWRLAHPNAVLFDDKDENIHAFKKAGGKAITVPRAWNRMYNRTALNYLPEALQEMGDI